MFNLISKTKLFLNYSLRIFKVLHCSVIKVRFVVFVVPYRSDLTILSHSFLLVKNFFNFFEEVFEVLFRRMYPLSQAELVYLTMSESVCQQLFKEFSNSFW